MLSRERERDLVERAQAGDASAREELIESFLPYLRASAWKMLPRQADDLVQVGVMRMLDLLPTFDASTGFRFATYALRPAFGEMRRYIGEHVGVARVPHTAHRSETTAEAAVVARAPVTSLSEPAGRSAWQPEVSDAAASEKEDELEKMRACIARLKPKLRQVLEYHVRGMTHKEIAVAMGIPIGTISSMTARAKEQLRYMMTRPDGYAGAAQACVKSELKETTPVSAPKTRVAKKRRRRQKPASRPRKYRRAPLPAPKLNGIPENAHGEPMMTVYLDRPASGEDSPAPNGGGPWCPRCGGQMWSPHSWLCQSCYRDPGREMTLRQFQESMPNMTPMRWALMGADRGARMLLWRLAMEDLGLTA